VNAVDWVLVAFGALVALSVGSFTCVVIDRLPMPLEEPNEFGESWDTRPWGDVVGGVSRCTTCGERIRPRDEIPVLSWLLLRGRCRNCGASIPSFHPWVELSVPMVCALLVLALGWTWLLVPVLFLVPVGIAVAVIDLRTLIVPTDLVWPSLVVSIALSVGAAFAVDQPARLVTAAVCAVVLAMPLALVWWFIPRGMGFGDVRLSVLLGWTVGLVAGTQPVLGVVQAFVCLFLAAVLGLILGLVVLGARGRKAQVPFGPTLVLSAFLCIAFSQQILEPFGGTPLR
jgi:leader peptidase (prepilin peptidase) / N-methyltransferase